MILESGDLKLIPATHEDEGLLVFDEKTRILLYEKVLSEITKQPLLFLSNMLSKNQMNRDKCMFTFSIFGACFFDGITSNSTNTILQAIDIYDKWITSSPRIPLLSNEFLILMFNQLTLPFSTTNEPNISERLDLLLKITILLRRISVMEAKPSSADSSQIDQQLLSHLLKIHLIILNKIMTSAFSYDRQCIPSLSETMFSLLLLCEPTHEIKQIYKLFPKLFAQWMPFQEFRSVFIKFLLEVQGIYLIHYKSLPIIPITPPFPSNFPFGPLFIKEGHLRLLWMVLIPCCNVSKLIPTALLEISKTIGDLLDSALSAGLGVNVLNRYYGNLYFSLIQQYNHLTHQEAINFCIIKTLDFYEKRVQDVRNTSSLLSSAMVFIKYCLNSESINIVMGTLSSFNRLLNAHISEFILLYKDVVYSMLQLTSIYDTSKDKVPLATIIETIHSLKYYFPLLKECDKINNCVINVDEVVKMQLAVFTTTDQLGSFPKGYCEKYFNAVADFIAVFGGISKVEICNYLYSFEGTIQRSINWLFQSFDSKEFVSLYRVFESILTTIRNAEYPHNIIEYLGEILIGVVYKLILHTSAQIINCFIDKVIEFATYNEIIAKELFVKVDEMMKYIADNDSILVKKNLERIMAFYYFCMSHDIQESYYNRLNEQYLLNIISNNPITFGSPTNSNVVMQTKELTGNDLERITIWSEGSRIVSCIKNKPKELIVITRGWSGTETYFVTNINNPQRKSEKVVVEKEMVWNEKYVEDSQGITEFNRAICKGKGLMIDEMASIFCKTKRPKEKKEKRQYKGDWANNEFCVLWRGSMMRNEERRVSVLENAEIIRELQGAMATSVRNRIYFRIVQKDLGITNDVKGPTEIRDATLQVVFKKENNKWVGKRRRNAHEFIYSIGDEDGSNENKTKNNVVVFLGHEIPKQTQSEEYVVGIKTVDWRMRKIEIKCIDKIEYIGFRNEEDVIETLEGEIMRLMQRDFPEKMVTLESDDIIKRRMIEGCETNKWMCDDRVGTFLGRNKMIHFIEFWNDKHYKSFKDEVFRSQEKTSEAQVECMNDVNEMSQKAKDTTINEEDEEDDKERKRTIVMGENTKSKIGKKNEEDFGGFEVIEKMGWSISPEMIPTDDFGNVLN